MFVFMFLTGTNVYPLLVFERLPCLVFRLVFMSYRVSCAGVAFRWTRLSQLLLSCLCLVFDLSLSCLCLVFVLFLSCLVFCLLSCLILSCLAFVLSLSCFCLVLSYLIQQAQLGHSMAAWHLSYFRITISDEHFMLLRSKFERQIHLLRCHLVAACYMDNPIRCRHGRVELSSLPVSLPQGYRSQTGTDSNSILTKERVKVWRIRARVIGIGLQGV